MEDHKPGTVRVAACQIEVADDVDANWAAIETALQQAVGMGAQIACFPETSLYGWVNPNAHQLAHPIPGPDSQRIGDLAKKYGLMVAIGLAERDGDCLYDSAILVDLDGKLLLRHRKVNILTELMDPPYTSGDAVVDLGGGSATNADAVPKSVANSVADTRFGRIGMLICADTFKDDVVKRIGDRQPDLVLVPYGWAAPEKDWPGHGGSLRAWVCHTVKRTQAHVVGVDAVGYIAHGPWTGYQYGGQSVVSSADGIVLGIMADRRAQVQVFDLQN